MACAHCLQSLRAVKRGKEREGEREEGGVGDGLRGGHTGITIIKKPLTAHTTPEHLSDELRRPGREEGRREGAAERRGEERRGSEGGREGEKKRARSAEAMIALRRVALSGGVITGDAPLLPPALRSAGGPCSRDVHRPRSTAPHSGAKASEPGSAVTFVLLLKQLQQL